MDTILLVLGVLGAGAVVIAAYVFMIAARNYVFDTDTDTDNNKTIPLSDRVFVERSRQNRRKNAHFDFPMTVNGMLIPLDRRGLSDRRCSVA